MLEAVTNPKSSLATFSKQLNGLLQAKVVVCKSVNPYFNLALENYLYENSTAKHCLLLYTNSPSVIIGRNQNPWVEANVKLCRDNFVNIIRRKSGGGTVFHDFGNLNYSVLMNREEFSHTENASIMIQALRNLGVHARLNQRHDIVLAQSQRKISGSAYKISRNRCYHHGTMLLNSDLEGVREYLRSPSTGILSKGVSSTRSPVSNTKLLKAEFMKQVISCFLLHKSHSTTTKPLSKPRASSKRLYDIEPESVITLEQNDLLGVPSILKAVNELQSWEWTFGQTPSFKQHLESTELSVSMDISVVHGRLEKVIFSTPNATLEHELSSIPWTGLCYESGFANTFLISGIHSKEAISILKWISDSI